MDDSSKLRNQAMDLLFRKSESLKDLNTNINVEVKEYQLLDENMGTLDEEEKEVLSHIIGEISNMTELNVFEKINIEDTQMLEEVPQKSEVEQNLLQNQAAISAAEVMVLSGMIAVGAAHEVMKENLSPEKMKEMAQKITPFIQKALEKNKTLDESSSETEDKNKNKEKQKRNELN